MLVVAEHRRPLVELDGLLHLVAGPREIAGAPRPAHRLVVELLEPRRETRPGEVGVLRTHGFGEVVREEGSLLVLRSARLGEPLREGGMEPAAARLGDRGVRHVSRERMLERIFALEGERRVGVTPDEVPLLEEREVRRCLVDEVQHGTGPENAPDHGGCLERRLVGGIQPIDARREHRVHGVRHREPLGNFASTPTSVVTLEDTGLDEITDELLQEERIPFGSHDDEVAQLGR